jgi:UDP-2,3-diacylglucosamine pyrophosphatase LpxH
VSHIISLTPPVLFVSDVHLNASQRDHNFFDFLTYIDLHKPIKSLVLVGDIFDFHLGYKKTLYRHLFPFYKQLSKWQEQGVALHMFTGNHDPDPDPFLVEDLGVQIHTHTVIFDVAGRYIRVEHGDQRDPTRLKRYICSFVRAPVIRAIARCLPPSLYMLMVQKILGSKEEVEVRQHTNVKKQDPNSHHKQNYDVPFPHNLIDQTWIHFNLSSVPLNTWIMGHYHRVACFTPHEDQSSTTHPLRNTSQSKLRSHKENPAQLPIDTSKLIFLGDWVRLHTFLYWEAEKLSLFAYEQGNLDSLYLGDHTQKLLTRVK